MAIVVRVGPLPLGHRRVTRVAELERILGAAVHLIEVATVTELVTAIRARDVVAVAVDAPRPGDLTAALEAASSLPVLRPLWRRQRNTRGEVDDVFDGYGLLTTAGIVGLADGELSTS